MLFSVFLVFAYVVTGRVLGKMKMLYKNIQYNKGNTVKAFTITSKTF